MSNEITNQVIELSADELDVVNGGAISSVEFAAFEASKTDIASLFTVGANGTTSLTQISDQKVSSVGGKAIFIS
jgi:hypothetical protein